MRIFVFIAVIMICASTCMAEALDATTLEVPGTLTGKIVTNDEISPEEGLIVSFFDEKAGPPPIDAGLRRVPEMVTRSDATGIFSVPLPPGKYYIGAMIRGRGVGPGPPKPGERFFFAMKDGQLSAFEMLDKETVDIGMIHVTAPEKVYEIRNFVTVEGVVSDENGEPVKGALVLVKKDINNPRPLFISQGTDDQGRYALKLPANTTYYLMARSYIQGGRPTPGSYVGAFGKTAPVQGTGTDGIGAPAGVSGRGGEGDALAISGKDGEVFKNINIVMFKIPDPEANRAQYQNQVQELKVMELEGEQQKKNEAKSEDDTR